VSRLAARTCPGWAAASRGLLGFVRADVVGTAGAGRGHAAHAAVALGAGDPRPERVGVPADGRGGVVFHLAALPADVPGGFPQFHRHQGRMLVTVSGPGPVLTRHAADLLLSGAGAVAGVAGAAEHYSAGVLGVAQDLVHGHVVPGLVSGGRGAVAVRRRAMPLQSSFSYTRHSNIRVTHGPRSGSGTSRARVAPIDAFSGLGWSSAVC
jgi:hypothetical protein